MDLTAPDAARLPGPSVRPVSEVFLRLRRRLQTQLIARTPLPGTADTLSRYLVGTLASSTHLLHVSGLAPDQQLRVWGIVFDTIHESIRRGFQDDQLFYRGKAPLTSLPL